MTILFYCENDENNVVENTLRDAIPDIEIRVWPDVGQKSDIRFAVAWGAPNEFYTGLNSLEVIFSLAAGVDHVLKQTGMPEDVPLVRLTDAGMGEKMAEYVLYGVLYAHRSMGHYRHAQEQKRWSVLDHLANAKDFQIGILGIGTLGKVVARKLLLNGYAVHGWARSEKNIAGVQCWNGETGLGAMLQEVDVVVCLLPLTDETTGFLDRKLFSKMKQNTYLINVARGSHLVDSDLIEAIDCGQLSGALLDVTHPEPLPENHPFWSHPDINVTPHISAPTQEVESVGQIVSNLKRYSCGEPMSGLVDRSRGY